MAATPNKEPRLCYHQATGKYKYLMPSFYNNSKLMMRTGWVLSPEIEDVTPLTDEKSHDHGENMLHPTAEAKTAEAITALPDPEPTATAPKVAEAPKATAPKNQAKPNVPKRSPKKQA